MHLLPVLTTLGGAAGLTKKCKDMNSTINELVERFEQHRHLPKLIEDCEQAGPRLPVLAQRTDNSQLRLLALEIGAEHAGFDNERDRIQTAGSNLVMRAIRIGDLLNAAFKLVPKGQWEQWVRSSLTFSVMTAFKYRTLATCHAAKPDKLTGCDSLRHAYLVSGAIKVPKASTKASTKDEEDEGEGEGDEGEGEGQDQTFTAGVLKALGKLLKLMKAQPESTRVPEVQEGLRVACALAGLAVPL